MSSLPRAYSICVLVLLVSTVEIRTQCTLNPLLVTLVVGGVSYRLGSERGNKDVQAAVNDAVDRAEEEAEIRLQQALATANAEAQTNQQAAVDQAVGSTETDLETKLRACVVKPQGMCSAPCGWDTTTTSGTSGCLSGICLPQEFV